jgi:hypothetical protein
VTWLTPAVGRAEREESCKITAVSENDFPYYCPRCRGHLHRLHRSLLDKAVHLVVPVRRYRCADDECGWQGLLMSRRRLKRRVLRYRTRVLVVVAAVLAFFILRWLLAE